MMITGLLPVSCRRIQPAPATSRKTTSETALPTEAIAPSSKKFAISRTSPVVISRPAFRPSREPVPKKAGKSRISASCP